MTEHNCDIKKVSHMFINSTLQNMGTATEILKYTDFPHNLEQLIAGQFR